MLDALAGKRIRSNTSEFGTKQLLEISKQALKKGEINIAEQYAGRAIRKEKYEDASKERNPEPYFHLAEVLKQKASDETVLLPQRQKLLLQAASLYNFVGNCFNKSAVESKSEFATSHENVLPGKILEVQESLIVATRGDRLRCRFNPESKKIAIEQLREEAKRELRVINAKYDAKTGNEEDLRKLFIKQTADVKDLYKKIASKLKQFFAEIIQECLEVLGELPCEYEVILLGSLSREEMTPYSDLEWAILTRSDDEQSKIFFRNLTNLVHLQVINLGETILPCMDIEVLRGAWFYDDVTPKGISFDGLLDQASKTPLGNTDDFELIHNPTEMANFQSNFWYKKDPCLGEILLNVAPLDESRHALLDEYKMELEKILSEPCDLDSCAHDGLNTRPTRGSCRGLRTLQEDISRYKPLLHGLTSEYCFKPECSKRLLNYDGQLFDIKKTIYRLTDRVVVALSNVFEVGGKGSFEALDKLCERNVISPSAKDNVASAVAIALKMRLSTYLSAGKQEETIKGTTGNATSAYHIPTEKELFHFFYVSSPLFESLLRLGDDVKNRSEDLAQTTFFSFSDTVKGHIHCRLLNYKAASECYKRALENDPGNSGIEMRLHQIEALLSVSTDGGDIWDTYFTTPFLTTFVSDERNINVVTEMNEKNYAKIKRWGISVETIADLNKLAVLLMSQKTGEAYKCLQRAFTMEQTIFGDNPNPHSALTSALLGKLSSSWGERIFYFEHTLKRLPFSEEKENLTDARCDIYGILAQSYINTRNFEQAKLYSKKGLDLIKTSAKSKNRSHCSFLSLLAGISVIEGKFENALEHLRKVQEILKNTVGDECIIARTTRSVARMYSSLGKIDEAKELLLRGHEEAQDTHKMNYLDALGSLCWKQGLAEEAEQHYKEVLNQIIELASAKKFIIVSTLLVLSKIVSENKPSEAISYLEQAAKYLSDLNDNDIKFVFLKKIALRWESLKDYTKAYMYLNKALKLCGKSELTSEMELRREIGLRVKLVGLLKKVNSLPGTGESSITHKQMKNEQRQHYEKACDLLQKYLASGSLDCSGINMPINMSDELFSPYCLCRSEEVETESINEEIWRYINELSNAFDEFENENCISVSKTKEYQERLTFKRSKFSRDEPGENTEVYCTSAHNKRIECSLVSDYDNACVLARSILCDSNHSYLKTKEKSFLSLVESLPETRSCVNFFIKEAENAKNKKDIHQMIVFLELASSQASVIEDEAKIFKLVGECQLHLQSYRMAEISFRKAADIFRSVESSSELDIKVFYMESLIGLAKSRMLCNDVENALCACEEGLRIEPQLTTSIFLEKRIELLYFDARCSFLQITSSTPRTHLECLSEKLDTLHHHIHTNLENDFYAFSEQLILFPNILVMKVFILFRVAISEEGRMNARQYAKHFAEEHLNVEKYGNTNVLKNSEVENTRRTLRRFHSCLGQILVIQETENAEIFLKKSLPDFFVPVFTGTIIPLDEIIPLLDAITATKAASSSAQEPHSLFQQTLELCRDEYLKVNDNPVPLLNFFRNLGNHYVDGGGTEKATYAYEAGLEVVDHLISDAADQVNARGEMMLHLANMHRIQALENTGKGEVEESLLAEKYYKFENGNGTEKSSIHKYIMYANFLCDEGRFEEAIVVLNQAIQAGDKLWSTTVICSFSQRVLYGSDVKKYIESDGELLTKMGNLAYTSLVRAYVQLGNGREACKALDTLITNGEDLPRSAIYTTSCLSHLVAFCQKYLMSLIEDPSKLSFNDSEFPLSSENFAKLYHELGEFELALNLCERLKKSLVGFFVPASTGTIEPLNEIIPLLDAITATKAASSSEQESHSPFQQTLELCRDEYLKVNDNPFPLLYFFRNLGNHYVDGGGTEKATRAYEAGLEVVDYLISDAPDQVNARGEMMLHLANVHRLQALKNTGKGEMEENRLAEKYYKFENGNGTEKSSIHKYIMYANFLCNEGRFEEAIVVLNQAIEADDKLWSTTVICSFSQRVLYGSDVKKYIESDGELLTKMGNLAYTSLVRAYVQLGNGREACKALDILLKNGEDLPRSAIYTTSCLSHLIAFCQKYLMSLIKDPSKLSFDDSEFPLSRGNFAKLYYELGEYELALNLCEEWFTVSQPTNETEYLNKLSSVRVTADALVMMGRGDESIFFYRMFLVTLDQCEGILFKSFDEQHAIISQLSFPESRYVYLALGRMMLKHQDKIDDAIACYEHCVGLDPSDDSDLDWMGTLADLYQTKAFTNGKEDKAIYQKWMGKAQECFQKLINKNIKMTSLLLTTFASFLLRNKQFAEAISHFEELLAGETNSVIFYAQVDIPLSGVHIAREIRERGTFCLEVKVHIYYLIALAYFQCGKIEKAQECALEMEKYIENFRCTPLYYLNGRSLLAYTYKETGNERKAMEILKKVLEIQPGNMPVKQALEECATIAATTSS
ncbi:uncharacterized protein LOC114519715 [Dendronephthya gigantea]|uniref:uncharacterized protein LOC114519715 n=1 Tax=Dendronephthya gigantea TaxID=151771 RepID=UPI00106BE043|nr:uncharacterized protein LOC114519715 [Dendronephthya gigantea]